MKSQYPSGEPVEFSDTPDGQLACALHDLQWAHGSGYIDDDQYAEEVVALLSPKYEPRQEVLLHLEGTPEPPPVYFWHSTGPLRPYEVKQPWHIPSDVARRLSGPFPQVAFQYPSRVAAYLDLADALPDIDN